ncbi:MAG: 4Fe-4S cluster-binding domain-containing protein [Clostridia bacterium]|nr:4Fe-4S cluster-binding domain-containing protein [Clostridia bacterium]
MMNPYKTREGGATVTVFVPYDCGNNCPFCINKKEYANMEGFSVEKICKSIDIMNEITPCCDFVFTGGEPFANLESLQVMLNHIPATHKIFINTTLPITKNQSVEDVVNFIDKNKQKISYINCSRHLVKYIVESGDEVLIKVKKLVPVRVNCVLFKDYPKDKLCDYIERFRKYNIPIQFRFDYTDTTPENLYETKHDMIYNDLCKISTYKGLDGCRMRCGYHFDYKGLEITYHKTLPYSTIVEKDGDTTYDILYDIIIKQTGEIHSDWDGTKLDIDAYRKVVFEKYDLRLLDGVVNGYN